MCLPSLHLVLVLLFPHHHLELRLMLLLPPVQLWLSIMVVLLILLIARLRILYLALLVHCISLFSHLELSEEVYILAITPHRCLPVPVGQPSLGCTLRISPTPEEASFQRALCWVVASTLAHRDVRHPLFDAPADEQPSVQSKEKDDFLPRREASA